MVLRLKEKTDMINSEDVYKIGTLGKIHGVKGEINFTFTDDVFDHVDADYLILSLDGIFVPFFIEEYRFRSNERVLIKFCDVDTTDMAQELVGTEVFFPYSLSDRSAEEITDLSHLIGFRINDIGIISDVDDSNENMLFCVTSMQTQKEILIPAVYEWIKNVDIASKIIEMDIPEGLLDL